MIERLAQFVATRSLSREESTLADLIASQLAGEGVEVRRSGNNLWCEVGDAPRPRLLLNSHLDTVPPGQGWTADPWTPRIDNGRLIGLGANDAKGCVTAMLEAFLAMHRELKVHRPLGGTLILALTAEEEISGQGLSTILDQLQPLDAALVGEPTGLTPMIAQRGLLILRGVAKGRSTHPANTPPDSAQNAIVAAAEDLLRLRDFDWGPPHRLLGRTHANVTLIKGGIARNVIPDSCEFTLDIRTTPVESHATLYERLKQQLRSELHIHSDRLVSVDTPGNAAIVRAVLAALPDAAPAGSPAMSDMVFLADVPAVKIGPGQTQRSHTADEFIYESELRAGCAAYGRILRHYFQHRG